MHKAEEVPETGVLAERLAAQEARSSNESSLLTAAKHGETVALETLCRANAKKLFRTVHRITRNREDAEDAVQDSLLSAFLTLKSFDGRSTFSTWLTRIGINSALMLLRRRRRSREVPPCAWDKDENLFDVPDSAPIPKDVTQSANRGYFLGTRSATLAPHFAASLSSKCRKNTHSGRRRHISAFRFRPPSRGSVAQKRRCANR